MAIEDGQPETFTPTWGQTWHGSIKPMLPMNIALFLLCWAIGYMLGGYLWSVLLPVLVVGAMTLLARVGSAMLKVRVSGYGIEILRGSTSRGVAWANLERVALLTKHGGPVAGTYGIGLGATRAAMGNYESANTGPGLIGQGVVLIRSGPAELAAPHARQKVLLLLFSVDRRWPRGRIGDWVRAYRPDLMVELSASASPAP